MVGVSPERANPPGVTLHKICCEILFISLKAHLIPSSYGSVVPPTHDPGWKYKITGDAYLRCACKPEWLEEPTAKCDDDPYCPGWEVEDIPAYGNRDAQLKISYECRETRECCPCGHIADYPPWPYPGDLCECLFPEIPDKPEDPNYYVYSTPGPFGSSTHSHNVGINQGPYTVDGTPTQAYREVRAAMETVLQEVKDALGNCPDCEQKKV
tara:strand:+ start:1436 stop:2068 length:633 start_codon:yes stop_codon:yes gene_type:complete